MELKIQIKTMDLISKLMQGNTEKIRSFAYTPQKFRMEDSGAEVGRLVRGCPEEEGIGSGVLEEFYWKVAGNRGIDAHSVMVVRNEKVIASGSFAPFRERIPHISHSLCKSVTGLAVGLAVDRGFLALEDRIADIFGEQIGRLQGYLTRNITIRHLLTMSSGIAFNEVGAILENDWVKAYFDGPLLFEAGTQFAYNSTNSYLLSAAVQKMTGQGLLAFLDENLLKAMGITDWYWEVCPKGVAKGGWGLNLRIEDMAKLGILCMDGGVYNGERLISAEWMGEMTRKQIDTPKDISPYGYGYQTWMCKAEGAYQFNGMLGQNVVVLPKQRIVVATTCGSSNLFPPGDLMDLIMDTFGTERWMGEEGGNLAYFGGVGEGEEREKGNEGNEGIVSCGRIQETDNWKNVEGSHEKVQECAHMSLVKTLQSLEFHEPCKEWLAAGSSLGKGERLIGKRLHAGAFRLSEVHGAVTAYTAWLSGRCYQMEESSAGILPLFLQCLHNNYSPGMKKVAFGRERELFYIKVQEGEEVNQIYIGFRDYLYSDVTLKGETYMVGTKGYFTHNEDGVLVLKLRIAYVETSNCRTIKIFFDKDMMEMHLDELPSLFALMDGATSLILPSGKAVLTSSLNLLADADYTQYKVRSTLMPVIHGEKV